MKAAGRDTDTLVHEALALFQGGDLDHAEALLKQILAIDARHGNALSMLGEIHGTRGHMKEAIRLHEQAIRSDPKAARFRCYLGSALASEGRFREAMTQYERALKLHPDFNMAVTGTARVNLLRGKVEKAAAALTPRMSSEPDDRMKAVYAKVLQKMSDGDATLAFIDQHIDDLTDGTAQRDMHLLRAGIYEKKGDYAPALAEFQAANDTIARPYDHEQTTARYDSIINQFSRAALDGSPRATNESELPVFIVGMPRSGSTLIEQIIHAHPAAHGAGELSDLNDVLRDVSSDQDSSDAFDTVAEAYLTRLRGYHRKADRIVDKLLGNFEHLGIISRLFPGAKIIHARRDPIANCFSCFVHPLSPFLQPWAGKLEDVGRYHRSYQRLMQHWRDVGIPMLEVDYEQVVGDIEGEARRIIDYLGLPWDDQCLSFYKAKRNVTTMSYDQVNRPIYTSALSRTDKYGDLLDPLRAILESGDT